MSFASAARIKGSIMELHFMVIAILLLTLMAIYAIRRAERDMIGCRDLDQRTQAPPRRASR